MVAAIGMSFAIVAWADTHPGGGSGVSPLEAPRSASEGGVGVSLLEAPRSASEGGVGRGKGPYSTVLAGWSGGTLEVPV